MRAAISNIALTAFDHAAEIAALPEMGIEGLEVAPSRIWRDTFPGPDAKAVEDYRRMAEAAGVRIVGLHSLLFDHKDLGLFQGTDIHARTLDFFTHLSTLCRDLGGRTLIWGGGRTRGAVPFAAARSETIDFFGALAHRVAGHGTVFCLEPLGPKDTDFIHTLSDALDIVEAVDHPSLGIQVDAKALVANGEMALETLRPVAGRLDHVHVNEDALLPLRADGLIDHATFAGYLRAIGYDGFVTAEQRQVNMDDPLADARAAGQVLGRYYTNGSLAP